MDFNEIKKFIVDKTRENIEIVGDRLPCATQNGEFKYTDNCGWTGGFWVGLLNYCYLFTNDKSFFEAADKSRHRFLDRIYKTPDTLDHDVGFLYLPSEYARYKLRGEKDSLKVTLDAADSLAGRYNEKGKFIKAWNIWNNSEFGRLNEGRIIIDCMFNLPLLFIASKETGDKKYYDIAVNHANTVSKTILRDDFTIFHTYVFNPETGEPLFGQNLQGYKDDSCWSRGEAWALGGYTMAYNFTKDERYLELAVNIAKKYISMLEDDYIPVWDFDFRGQDVVRDASAAAIAASKLIDLSGYVKNEDDKNLFRRTAEIIVETLYNSYSSKDDSSFRGLIKHCTGFFNNNVDIDENLIYADYYFAEAVSKLADNKTIF